PEAIKRLKSLSEDDAIYCSKMDIWDLNTNLCQEVKNSRGYYRTSEIAIHIGDPDAPASGKLTILFDKTPFFNALISRILFTTSLFFIISLILSLLFRRFSRTISSELDSVVSVLSHGARSSEMNLNIHEFSMLAQKLRALVD